MDLRSIDPLTAWLMAKQWVPFGARTAFYGTLSVSLGPLTKDHRASLWAMRRWCESSAKGLGIDIEASGLENVPKSHRFVYASNHQSIVDILVLGAVLPGDFKWAAKRSLMKIPFLGWHLQLAGHVPVDRKQGSRAAADVIKRFQKVLDEDKPLLIFPEGTRSEDGLVRPFKNGGFYAAARANAPVVPVALEGTYQMMKRGKPYMDHGAVRVRIGAPIQPKEGGREGARVNDLRERTFEAVRQLHREIGGTVPDVVPESLPDRDSVAPG
jgi:1-acyl-sn-glycerol-3-phosphate acyltransferase